MNYHKRDLVWKSGLPFSYEEFPTQYPESCLSLSNIQPIYFAGNPHSPEVKSIIEENLTERKHLFEIYSQGEFLEITLSKLAEPE